MPHKIILKVNISHFGLIPIVLSFFHYFFSIFEKTNPKRTITIGFHWALVFPHVTVQNMGVHCWHFLSKNNSPDRREPFFLCRCQKIQPEARRQWHEIIINGTNKIRPSTVVQTLSIHKNFIRWTLVTRIILKPLN